MKIFHYRRWMQETKMTCLKLVRAHLRKETKIEINLFCFQFGILFIANYRKVSLLVFEMI